MHNPAVALANNDYPNATPQVSQSGPADQQHKNKTCSIRDFLKHSKEKFRPSNRKASNAFLRSATNQPSNRTPAAPSPERSSNSSAEYRAATPGGNSRIGLAPGLNKREATPSISEGLLADYVPFTGESENEHFLLDEIAGTDALAGLNLSPTPKSSPVPSDIASESSVNNLTGEHGLRRDEDREAGLALAENRRDAHPQTPELRRVLTSDTSETVPGRDPGKSRNPLARASHWVSHHADGTESRKLKKLSPEEKAVLKADKKAAKESRKNPPKVEGYDQLDFKGDRIELKLSNGKLGFEETSSKSTAAFLKLFLAGREFTTFNELINEQDDTNPKGRYRAHAVDANGTSLLINKDEFGIIAMRSSHPTSQLTKATPLPEPDSHIVGHAMSIFTDSNGQTFRTDHSEPLIYDHSHDKKGGWRPILHPSRIATIQASETAKWHDLTFSSGKVIATMSDPDNNRFALYDLTFSSDSPKKLYESDRPILSSFFSHAKTLDMGNRTGENDENGNIDLAVLSKNPEGGYQANIIQHRWNSNERDFTPTEKQIPIQLEEYEGTFLRKPGQQDNNKASGYITPGLPAQLAFQDGELLLADTLGELFKLDTTNTTNNKFTHVETKLNELGDQHAFKKFFADSTGNLHALVLGDSGYTHCCPAIQDKKGINFNSGWNMGDRRRITNENGLSAKNELSDHVYIERFGAARVQSNRLEYRDALSGRWEKIPDVDVSSVTRSSHGAFYAISGGKIKKLNFPEKSSQMPMGNSFFATGVQRNTPTIGGMLVGTNASDNFVSAAIINDENYAALDQDGNITVRRHNASTHAEKNPPYTLAMNNFPTDDKPKSLYLDSKRNLICLTEKNELYSLPESTWNRDSYRRSDSWSPIALPDGASDPENAGKVFFASRDLSSFHIQVGDNHWELDENREWRAPSSEGSQPASTGEAQGDPEGALQPSNAATGTHASTPLTLDAKSNNAFETHFTDVRDKSLSHRFGSKYFNTIVTKIGLSDNQWDRKPHSNQLSRMQENLRFPQHFNSGIKAIAARHHGEKDLKDTVYAKSRREMEQFHTNVHAAKELEPYNFNDRTLACMAAASQLPPEQKQARERLVTKLVEMANRLDNDNRRLLMNMAGDSGYIDKEGNLKRQKQESWHTRRNHAKGHDLVDELRDLFKHHGIDSKGSTAWHFLERLKRHQLTLGHSVDEIGLGRTRDTKDRSALAKAALMENMNNFTRIADLLKALENPEVDAEAIPAAEEEGEARPSLADIAQNLFSDIEGSRLNQLSRFGIASFKQAENTCHNINKLQKYLRDEGSQLTLTMKAHFDADNTVALKEKLQASILALPEDHSTSFTINRDGGVNVGFGLPTPDFINPLLGVNGGMSRGISFERDGGKIIVQIHGHATQSLTSGFVIGKDLLGYLEDQNDALQGNVNGAMTSLKLRASMATTGTATSSNRATFRMTVDEDKIPELLNKLMGETEPEPFGILDMGDDIASGKGRLLSAALDTSGRLGLRAGIGPELTGNSVEARFDAGLGIQVDGPITSRTEDKLRSEGGVRRTQTNQNQLLRRVEVSASVEGQAAFGAGLKKEEKGSSSIASFPNLTALGISTVLDLSKTETAALHYQLPETISYDAFANMLNTLKSVFSDKASIERIEEGAHKTKESFKVQPQTEGELTTKRLDYLLSTFEKYQHSGTPAQKNVMLQLNNLYNLSLASDNKGFLLGQTKFSVVDKNTNRLNHKKFVEQICKSAGLDSTTLQGRRDIDTLYDPRLQQLLNGIKYKDDAAVIMNYELKPKVKADIDRMLASGKHAIHDKEIIAMLKDPGCRRLKEIRVVTGAHIDEKFRLGLVVAGGTFTRSNQTSVDTRITLDYLTPLDMLPNQYNLGGRVAIDQPDLKAAAKDLSERRNFRVQD
ncbi:AvrE-family type 3 secretion system effector [Pokkaliibacter sp. CJK22405]|uniref:AvrE-family type 3 secretion system effector n=1 Tax=Pokkaliibacter sp. CJK22405 TaxID=3384615 RepID=UPI0039854D34